MPEFSHVSVLLNETIDSLHIKEDGIYLDATCGGAGHSSVILTKLSDKGRLIAMDQDPDAIEVIKSRIGSDPRVTIVHDNFCNIPSVLQSLGLEGVDGILADLGVSSYQLDTPERGFSFHTDAPLDMRMSKDGMTAADLIATASEQELKKILYTYGEEKFAPSIAAAIVREREKAPIETTLQLSEIVKNAVPQKARRQKHPGRKTFQALRIAVNGEMDVLNLGLDGMFDSLNVGGILSIITFHSLEDRMVKQRFAQYCEGCTCPPEFPVCVCGKTPAGKLVFKYKAPSDEELEINSRSRSAKLRAIEKLKERS
ncbi:MAG: 16S rRNA (cytosine(1402)-N(4))-methyltransferase RsmH [Clostridia bacterium]|nr:16S rRNA (cytosine(1402)-N(4))-methyltransferase RsmH [Clostridia bacterium]